MDYSFDFQEVNLNSEKEINQVSDFLDSLNLSYEPSDYSIILKDNNKIIGTGSVKGEILKCIGVDCKYQGYNLSEKIVSKLIEFQVSKGINHRFVFTKSDNVDSFTGMGFQKIAEVYPQLALLEGGEGSINDYIEKLREETPDGFLEKEAAGIVVNCNPITKGHLHLLGSTAEKHDVVHIFVVSEDRSLFPSAVRYQLVKDAVKDIKNIVVHHGGKYVISSATFPSYFLKKGEATKLQTKLDITIFGKHLAPALNIKFRYVAEEPYCPVTNTYNQTMKEVLPLYGVELIEIKRKKLGDEIISASKVRNALRENQWGLVQEMVPENVYNFLQTDKGKEIVKKIKENITRH